MSSLHDSGFEYLAFDPPAAEGGARPEKLVILLHGYGRNAHYMEKMAHAAIQAVPNARVLCVHGQEAMTGEEIAGPGGDHDLHLPQEMQPGMLEAEIDSDPTLRTHIRRQWFAIDGRLPALLPRIDRVSTRMNEFIDSQRDMLGLQDSDIVLMGFSQGAGLALYTAFSRKGELGGMICHSSIIIHSPDNQDSRFISHPRVFYVYGEEDPEFPQQRFRDTFTWIQNYTNGRAVEKTVAGLGHYTNAKSRQLCADFLREVLG